VPPLENPPGRVFGHLHAVLHRAEEEEGPPGELPWKIPPTNQAETETMRWGTREVKTAKAPWAGGTSTVLPYGDTREDEAMRTIPENQAGGPEGGAKGTTRPSKVLSQCLERFRGKE